ncbi:type IX secretion system membrane protein PorP/SprF [Flavobacterium rhamnosiphilum]|uniref:Type IX secretion system membrane protein PorP/SprF n=1 Tax=Flavobacterium rhamnosiphilum TaxID=2541724 RepID=A0A4R5F4H1_9FLAO|nr:type IX secretion system membrane protein PorP/SprF [Flavobacterium rhamnosiphilum]TDE42477.1 type IX secretion system membrane protein PorP/SprF [Flavobacterium rhamnosiphilum]
MKTVKNILAGALLLLSSALFAQQESTFTMYRYHMNMINPAYAGVDGETVVTGSFRRQWTGIKDAPESQAVSFGTNVGSNLGLGISMVSDKTFIEKQTMLGIDFSYKLKMNETMDLYLGFKAGGNFYDVNTSGLQTYLSQSDPALESINHFNPNVGVGALLKNEKFFVSLSVPRILNTERAKNDDGYASVATDRPHIYLSGGYDFNLNSDASLVLKPSFMLRYVNGAPVSIDINSMIQIQNNFEIGAMYRTDEAFAGIVDFTISKRMMVGYAYEVSTRTELASAKNTNEFFIRFKF